MPTELRHNEERNRYELIVDGDLVGVADYHAWQDKVEIPHTEIHPSMRGQGLGAQLVKGALDDVRRSGRSVVPTCWYVAQFIDEHPEYADLVSA